MFVFSFIVICKVHKLPKTPNELLVHIYQGNMNFNYKGCKKEQTIEFNLNNFSIKYLYQIIFVKNKIKISLYYLYKVLLKKWNKSNNKIF